MSGQARGRAEASIRPPVDSAWLTEQLRELERLADDGDTLEVVGKLALIVREPVRESLPATGQEAVRPRIEASLRTADEPSQSA